MTMNEHVFKVVDNGDTIEFIGDFEGLYKSEDDPWEQSVRFCSQQNQCFRMPKPLNLMLRASEPRLFMGFARLG